MTQYNLPAVAQHTGSTTLGRVGARVGVNLTPWPPVERSPWAYAGNGYVAEDGYMGARQVWQDEGGPVMFTETDARPYMGARQVWQDEGGPVMFTETDASPYAGGGVGVNLTPWPPVERSPSAFAFAGGADVRTQAIVGAAAKRKSQIYGMVLPPRGYAGRARASNRRRAAAPNSGMFPIGSGSGTVTLTADPGIGIVNINGRQSYVRILSRSGNQVTVRPTTYSPSGFSGAAVNVARGPVRQKFPTQQTLGKKTPKRRSRRSGRGTSFAHPAHSIPNDCLAGCVIQHCYGKNDDKGGHTTGPDGDIHCKNRRADRKLATCRKIWGCDVAPGRSPHALAIAGSNVRPLSPDYPGNARLGIMGSGVRPDFPSYPGNARMGIMGGQYRPAFPSYPGRVGGMMGGQYRPAFPSYPGRVGYAGQAHDHDHGHDDHGGACCAGCANGSGCEGCNGDCGPDCGCKG